MRHDILARLLQPGQPGMLRIGITTRCQLRCPECHTASGRNRKGLIGWGDMSSTVFASLLDDNPAVKSVELAHLGEVFLHKELPIILQMAHRRGVVVTMNVGVNLNSVSRAALLALVRYRVERITVAIDGSEQEIYAQYRRGGRLPAVIKNIRAINVQKKKKGSILPKMTWQFVRFRHNAHQADKARVMAAALGMDFVERLNWNESEKEEALFRVDGSSYPLPCRQLWVSPQINWDGALLGCCDNKAVAIGNVVENGLTACLKSVRYLRMKKIALGEIKPRRTDACFHCAAYRLLPASVRVRSVLRDLLANKMFKAVQV